MKNKYFLLFDCCKLVKGVSNSIIMDLQRGEYLRIPNILYEILNQNLKENSIDNLKKIYNHEFDQGIEKYVDYLVKEEFGFLTDEPNLFPKSNLDFKSPFKIISSVVCIDKYSNFSVNDILSQLTKLGCQIIQIRVYNFLNLNILLKNLEKFGNSIFNLVELFIPYSNSINFKVIQDFLTKYPAFKIIVHSINSDNILSKKKCYENYSLKLTKKIINSETREIYEKEFFQSNSKFYYEALQFNIGLNRKVCVDTDGSVKNYINHTKTYGNILDTSLKDIIERDDFQYKWSISNDKIEKCKECQYRYMCLSNSDIIQKDNKFYKKEYCSFEL